MNDTTLTEKRCAKCLTVKPAAAFNKKLSGLQPACRLCDNASRRDRRQATLEHSLERNRAYYRENRERVLAQKRGRGPGPKLAFRYGITLEQYTALLAYQGGKCAGCGVEQCPSGRALSVDHDHSCCPVVSQGHRRDVSGACGKCVRGLVCMPCNMQNVLVGRPHVNWTDVSAPSLVS